MWAGDWPREAEEGFCYGDAVGDNFGCGIERCLGWDCGGAGWGGRLGGWTHVCGSLRKKVTVMVVVFRRL